MASHTRTFAIAYDPDGLDSEIISNILLCLGGEWVPQYSPFTDQQCGLPTKVVGVTPTHVLVKVRACKAALRLLRFYTAQANANPYWLA